MRLFDHHNVADGPLLRVAAVSNADGLAEPGEEQPHVQGAIGITAEVLQLEHHVVLQHFGQRQRVFIAALCAGVVALMLLFALFLAYWHRSWPLALGTLVNTAVLVGAAALVTYLGVNWVIDRAERAFLEDPAAVGRSLQELGQRVGIDSSVVDEWIESMRARLAQ